MVCTMPYYKITISLIAGICLGFGILYLFIGLRRKNNNLLNLTFALFALCYATTLFNGIRWYSATSVAEFVRITRWDAIFVVGAFVSLIWYISFYTGVGHRIFLWILSATFIVSGLANLLLPNMVYGEILGLTSIDLPWGEKLTDLDATGSVWFEILLLAQLVTLGYIIFALIRQYWRGQRRPALILGLGMLPFIAGIFYEVLGESGVVPYIPFAEFGFLGIAIVASLQMANSVIRTEEELDEHRQNLAGLVEARTAELSQSNQQLVQEVEKREQAEAVLRQSEERFRKVFEEGPIGMTLVAPDFRLMQVNAAFCRMLGYSGDELTALTFADITHPDDVDNDVSLAQQLFTGHIPSFNIEKRYIKKNGDALWGNLTASVIHNDAGQTVYGLGMIENITERKQVEQALNQRLEELSVLHYVAEILARATDLPPSLQAISETSLHFFQARTIHIIVPTLTEAEQVLMVGFERDAGPIGPTILDLSLKALPLASDVVRSGQTQVFSDIQTLELEPLLTAYIREHNLQTVILAPLRVRGQTIGLMTVATEDAKRNFSPNEIKLAESIASDIAAAVENARLSEQTKVVAVAEERGRLARDLHDSVTQTLYSASLVAEALPQVWENNPAEIKDHLTVILQLIRGALAEMRTLLLELRPETLEKTDLTTLLRQLGDALTGQTQIPVQLTVEGPAPALPPEVKIGLFRMAQEIFNNISKHAHATEVRMNLKNLTSQVILEVQDNGRGFDPMAVAPERMGLRIMQERADDIGAGFELESRPGQGTRISIICEGWE